MLVDKGVYEFYTAAKALKKEISRLGIYIDGSCRL